MECFFAFAKAQLTNPPRYLKGIYQLAPYLCWDSFILDLKTVKMSIAIKEVSKVSLACINVKGLGNIAHAYDKLVAWAAPKGLLDRPNVKMVTVYHDSFKDTAANQVRISVGILLNHPIELDNEVKLLELEPHRCIVASMELEYEGFAKAWSNLYSWKNRNGYQISGNDPFEIHHNNYRDHPQKKCMVDLYIPIL